MKIDALGARSLRHPAPGGSRVLVTGGSGFIGSHVVDQLVAAGHVPRVFDLRPWPYAGAEGIEQVSGDLLSLADVRAAADGCDAIVHLAAAADVGEVEKQPTESEALNARGTISVLEAARALGIRVIYASTIWVYSDVEASDVDETTPLPLPSHLYTASKLAGEMYCRSYEELYGVQATILRFGIPYGPRARPAAVVPIFIRKALAGEALTIAGDGMQTRRFVYVEDLADGVVRALRPEAAGRIYNLVGDEDTSVRGIADAVRDAVGPVEIVHTEGRRGDFGGVRVCGERAAAELGWRASTPFADGVRRYLAWHVAQEQEAAPAVVAPVAPTVPMRRRAGALIRQGALALAGLAALVLYAVTLHAAGLSGSGEHTVAVIAVLGIALGATLRPSRNSRIAAWVVAIIAGLLLIPEPLRHDMDFQHLNLRLLMLGLAGAGFGLLAIDGGRRALTPEVASQREG